MIVECWKCRRYIPSNDSDKRVSSTVCPRCFIIFKDCNGGVDWKTATEDEKRELKEEFAAFDHNRVFQGEPKVVWPKEGLEYVESLIQELESKREARDGSRR